MGPARLGPIGTSPGQAGQVVVRPAVDDDLATIVDHTWAVAAEGRWIGTEVPFDRDTRRQRLSTLMSSETSTLLVADATPAGGPGVVGQVSVVVAPYGVADIGMLVIAGWRGRGVGTALLQAGISWARAAGAHKVALFHHGPDRTDTLIDNLVERLNSPALPVIGAAVGGELEL